MNGRKVLLLGILVLLPVLAFLFLQTFGRNAYKLRTYLPESVTLARVGAPPVPAPTGRGATDTVYHRVNDTGALTTSTGQPFSLARDLRGHVVVLVFSRTTGAYPGAHDAVHGLARVQERFRTQPAVKLLVVAPAPGAGLAALAERSGAISGKWTFASAEPAVLAHLLTELRDSASLTNPATPTRLWLLDRTRHLRGIYEPADPREIDRLLTEVDILLKIEHNPRR